MRSPYKRTLAVCIASIAETIRTEIISHNHLTQQINRRDVEPLKHNYSASTPFHPLLTDVEDLRVFWAHTWTTSVLPIGSFRVSVAGTTFK